MRKSLVFMFSILIISLFIFGCAQENPAAEEPAPEKVPAQPIEEPIPTETVENVTPAAETAPVEEETKPVAPKHQIIYPRLKYDGAYNGPLYGTSEQVGSASMDSYFKLLDNNGINYFIGMFGIEGEPAADNLVSNEGLGEVIDAV